MQSANVHDRLRSGRGGALVIQDRADPTAHALAALDLRLGIVEGFRTQRAAQQASWVVTQMAPKRAEDLFERVGNMAPSKSSLDRLPKAFGERWESEREKYEQSLREAILDFFHATEHLAAALAVHHAA